MSEPPAPGSMFDPGVAVDVRSRFEGSWSQGFEVAEVAGAASDYRYRLRRVGGAMLPVWFSADEISPARDHASPVVSRREGFPTPSSSSDPVVVLRPNHPSDRPRDDGYNQEPEARDGEADKRDVRANRRDREADRRDQAAAARDEDASTDMIDPGRPDTSAVARREAAADRAAAATDRRKSRIDRERAARDRHRASTEREAASKDDLTGLLRRGAGLAALEREVDRSRRSGDPVVVSFLDVDGLKQVNDSRGHQAGDAMLLAVADGLRAALRSYDLIVRYGGDEFLIASPGMSTPEMMSRMLTMRADLATAPQPVSVSFGLAELQSDDDIETLVARADNALYDERPRR